MATAKARHVMCGFSEPDALDVESTTPQEIIVQMIQIIDKQNKEFADEVHKREKAVTQMGSEMVNFNTMIKFFKEKKMVYVKDLERLNAKTGKVNPG